MPMMVSVAVIGSFLVAIKELLLQHVFQIKNTAFKMFPRKSQGDSQYLCTRLHSQGCAICLTLTGNGANEYESESMSCSLLAC